MKSQLLARSYSPVGCATTEPLAEIEKAGNKRLIIPPEPSHQKRKQEKGITRRTAAVEQQNVQPEKTDKEETDKQIQRQVQFMIKHSSPIGRECASILNN